jgi:transcriptional regulator with XRE-family HTH domain
MGVAQQEKDISVCLRLREERKAKGLDQQKIADALGVNIKTVGRWEKNIAIPSDKLAALQSFGVDVYYVVTGQHAPVVANGLSSDEAELVEHYRQLPDGDRLHTHKMVTALVEMLKASKRFK